MAKRKTKTIKDGLDNTVRVGDWVLVSPKSPYSDNFSVGIVTKVMTVYVDLICNDTCNYSLRYPANGIINLHSLNTISPRYREHLLKLTLSSAFHELDHDEFIQPFPLAYYDI